MILGLLFNYYFYCIKLLYSFLTIYNENCLNITRRLGLSYPLSTFVNLITEFQHIYDKHNNYQRVRIINIKVIYKIIKRDTDFQTKLYKYAAQNIL